MNFSKLLSSRQTLLRQAHLANLAHSYFTIRRLADRVTNANLRGLVRLRPTTVGDEACAASLAALEGNQSVIEEHFTVEDILELADSMEFAVDGSFAEIEFRLDELGVKFGASLRVALDRAGVVIDQGDAVEGQTSHHQE